MENSHLHEYIKMGIRRQLTDGEAMAKGPSKDEFFALPSVQAYWADQDSLRVVKDYWGKLSTPFASYSHESVLIAMGALTDTGQPTPEGVLYFHSEPQQWLPLAFVYCSHYAGIDRTQKLSESCLSGRLVYQYEQCLKWLEQILKMPIIEAIRATEAKDATIAKHLCEGVFNALVHRNYGSKSKFIHIDVFSDRVEIINPTIGRRFVRRSDWRKIYKIAFNPLLYVLSFPMNPNMYTPASNLNQDYLGQYYFLINQDKCLENFIDFKLTLVRPEAPKIWVDHYRTGEYFKIPPHLGEFFTMGSLDFIDNLSQT